MGWSYAMCWSCCNTACICWFWAAMALICASFASIIPMYLRIGADVVKMTHIGDFGLHNGRVSSTA
jgi:hypothetical protein